MWSYDRTVLPATVAVLVIGVLIALLGSAGHAFAFFCGALVGSIRIG